MLNFKCLHGTNIEDDIVNILKTRAFYNYISYKENTMYQNGRQEKVMSYTGFNTRRTKKIYENMFILPW